MKYSFKNNNSKVPNGWVLFALLGMLMTFGACKSESPSEETMEVSDNDNALVVSQLLASNSKVKIGELTEKKINQEIHCTGMIELPPSELVFMHSRTAGFVRMLKYIPGDYVRKGSLVALIENSKLLEAQRTLMETKAELDFANGDFERKRQLKESNATTEKSYQEALSHKNRLTATYEGLKSELTLFGINIEKLEQENKYQSSIGVYASTSGYVHSVDVNMGQMIQPEDKLMEIANNEHMHLELNVLSKDAAYIKIGQKVRYQLSNNKDVLEAEVVKINPMVDEETNTVNVHCHINSKDKHVKLGLFANATILGEAGLELGLPLEAVLKSDDKYFGYRVVGDELKRELLSDTKVVGDWITFSNSPVGQWVITGAYYLDGGE